MKTTQRTRTFAAGQTVYLVYSNSPGHWALREDQLVRARTDRKLPRGYWEMEIDGCLVHENNMLTEEEAAEARLTGRLALPWNGMVVQLSK